ncbi:type II secretion system major pseudopilin GspG [Roseiterribacter gracilis]|uniref:Type II secretion system core protein G n=1 Tax=Roseiterribacter gracilis TaxID=2812848 RepID=A0A8S8XIJ0_9PROT|nr:type II secretion system protein GspG [Rhodospirillales bacterium TMPK1]
MNKKRNVAWAPAFAGARCARGRRAQRGFTLLEMLVVLVIIGLVVGLVGTQLFNRLDRSKVTAAETQVKLLKSALDTMKLDLGRYPDAQEGLQLLLVPPADPALRRRWTGPYLDGQVPVDPWGRAYVYDPKPAANGPVTLYSLGADGKPGGTDLDADIGFLPAR